MTHTSNGKPRAALYARVSTSGKGQDPALQLEALRRVARQRDWHVVNEYVDIGVSGKKDHRPALDNLMADCHAGKIDVVAVWKFDRFGRSLRHLVEALAEFEAIGVAFVSVTESIDSGSPIGKAMFHIIGALAEFEHSLISERIAAGVARARKAGKKFGRPRNDIDMARVNRLLKHGHSLRSISRLLDVSRGTLRYRLKQAGEKSPTSGDAGTHVNAGLSGAF